MGDGLAPSGFLLREARPGRHFFRACLSRSTSTRPSPALFSARTRTHPPRLVANSGSPTAGSATVPSLSEQPRRPRPQAAGRTAGRRSPVIGGTGVVVLRRGETARSNSPTPLPSRRRRPRRRPLPPRRRPRRRSSYRSWPAMCVVLTIPKPTKRWSPARFPSAWPRPSNTSAWRARNSKPAGPLTDGRITSPSRSAPVRTSRVRPAWHAWFYRPSAFRLTTVADTASKGALEKPGDLLTLTAEGLVLADSDVEGDVHHRPRRRASR